MNWIIYAALAALSFGFYNLFIKLSSQKFSPLMANIFIAGTSCFVAILVTIYLKYFNHEIIFSKSDLKVPIITGLFVGAGEIFLLATFSKNAPLTIGYPVIIGGTTIIVALLGIIVLKESVNAIKLIGIAITLIGIIILSRS